MDVGTVRVAEDCDFEKLKSLLENHNGWKLDYHKAQTKVWTKSSTDTNFKMIKIKTIFNDVDPQVMYDVLHDPDYRKVWDDHMIESRDIGCLNPNNDIGYYALSCPPPLQNRDFVLQRSWLDVGSEQYILNHSVYHQKFPPRKGFVRAKSHLTGFLVRVCADGGCELGYVSQTDPQGKLPSWLVNRVTQIFAPKMVKRLHKASLGYKSWKLSHNPEWKPWHFPEQITAPRISVSECVQSEEEKKCKHISSGIDESLIKETNVMDGMDDP
ncbi:START domain-containing protein 10-like [Ischnura elegans]|uniref:START domain-containing protein 10-like n=1 Tax=Ischnura elegans TaxID=197161 RepID=UPI001ED8A700|nr:START domain-containing protein 10-like [Ischnura elegans]